jgi:glycerophosphoryl diester phosphodiesterase
VTTILGHRGAPRAAPENTIASFQLARSQGADGVELDVRRTVDDGLAVHHDAVLADGRPVHAVPVRSLPESVPTLRGALRACTGMIVNIELKNWPREPGYDAGAAVSALVAAELAEAELPTVWLSSFDRPTIDRFHEDAPHVPSGLLLAIGPPSWDRLLAELATAGHTAVHPHGALVDEALVDAAHAVGLRVVVWTVDEPDRLRGLARFGVDAIITNVPDVAREALSVEPR